MVMLEMEVMHQTFRGATNPDHLFYGHIQAIKYYSKSLPINQLTGIDTSPPSVT